VDWTEALEHVIDQTKHARYRTLTADDHQDHELWRRQVIEMAGGDPGPPRSCPPLLKQAGNVLEAAKRLAATWWAGESVTVDKIEAARRMAICFECDKYDPNQGRCVLCGCWSKWKNRLATEHCPLPESEGGPKW
jgi:hypothetical protein